VHNFYVAKVRKNHETKISLLIEEL